MHISFFLGTPPHQGETNNWCGVRHRDQHFVRHPPSRPTIRAPPFLRSGWSARCGRRLGRTKCWSRCKNPHQMLVSMQKPARIVEVDAETRTKCWSRCKNPHGLLSANYGLCVTGFRSRRNVSPAPEERGLVTISEEPRRTSRRGRLSTLGMKGVT